jgi:hypothetical protein
MGQSDNRLHNIAVIRTFLPNPRGCPTRRPCPGLAVKSDGPRDQQGGGQAPRRGPRRADPWRRDRDNARGPRLTNCQRGRPPFGEIAPAHSGIPPTRQGTRTRQTRAGSKTLPTATRSCDAKLYGVDADQALLIVIEINQVKFDASVADTRNRHLATADG